MSEPQSLSAWQGPGAHREMTVVGGVEPEVFPAPVLPPETLPAPEAPVSPPAAPPVAPPPVPEGGLSVITAQSGASAGHAGAVPPDTAHGWQVKPRWQSLSDVQVVGEAPSTRPTNARELNATEATTKATRG